MPFKRVSNSEALVAMPAVKQPHRAAQDIQPVLFF
jgi:hypothetical protein